MWTNDETNNWLWVFCFDLDIQYLTLVDPLSAIIVWKKDEFSAMDATVPLSFIRFNTFGASSHNSVEFKT